MQRFPAPSGPAGKTDGKQQTPSAISNAMKRTLLTTCLGLVLANASDAAIIELVQNGNFGSGSLDPWVQISPASPMEWGVSSGGNVGGNNIHAADYSPFATPWTKGPNPSTTIIAQTIDLSSYLGSISGDTLSLSADLIYSNDSISCTVKFYDNSDNTISEKLLAEKRNYSDNWGLNYALNEDLAIPANATSVQILFEGKLYDGSYIDSGFDAVSLTADVVPEPSTLMVLAALLLGLSATHRRRKP
jgi:hypothetical protein